MVYFNLYSLDFLFFIFSLFDPLVGNKVLSVINSIADRKEASRKKTTTASWFIFVCCEFFFRTLLFSASMFRLNLDGYQDIGPLQLIRSFYFLVFYCILT